MAALEIRRENAVYYKVRSDVTIVCRGMNFALYPFDRHVCYLKLTSCKFENCIVSIRDPPSAKKQLRYCNTASCVTAKSCTLGFPMQPAWLQKTLLLLFQMQPLWLHWKLEDAIFVLLACNQPGCTRNPRMQLFCNPPGCIWHWRMQLWPPFFGLMALPALYLSTWMMYYNPCLDFICF